MAWLCVAGVACGKHAERLLHACSMLAEGLGYGLDWIGLDWIGLDWIGLDHFPPCLRKACGKVAERVNRKVGNSLLRASLGLCPNSVSKSGNQSTRARPKSESEFPFTSELNLRFCRWARRPVDNSDKSRSGRFDTDSMPGGGLFAIRHFVFGVIMFGQGVATRTTGIVGLRIFDSTGKC